MLFSPRRLATSEHPINAYLRDTFLSEDEALHPYSLMPTICNNHSSLSGTEGGIRGFLVFVCDGLH